MVAAATMLAAAGAPVTKVRTWTVKCRRCNQVPEVRMKGRDDAGFLAMDVGKGAGPWHKVRESDEKVFDGWRQRLDFVVKRSTVSDTGFERRRYVG